MPSLLFSPSSLAILSVGKVTGVAVGGVPTDSILSPDGLFYLVSPDGTQYLAQPSA
jgi:hypothetical protein